MKISEQKILTFLSFGGDAEEAINFYVNLFDETKIVSLTCFEKGQAGEEGKVLNGCFELFGQQFMAMDMQGGQTPPMGWGTSLFVKCSDEREFDKIFSALANFKLQVLEKQHLQLYKGHIKCAC